MVKVNNVIYFKGDIIGIINRVLNFFILFFELIIYVDLEFFYLIFIIF